MPCSLPTVRGAVLAVIAVASACDRSDRPGQWSGSVDTLQTGTIIVRNPSEGIWTSARSWRLVESLRIGSSEGTGPDVFGHIRALAVDGLGRIYVLESQTVEIRVFDRDGRHVRSWGRRGEGPGESDNPTGLMWGAEGWLWVPDPGNGRYTAFDTAGAYVTNRRRRASFYRVPFIGMIDTLGRFYDTGLRPSHDGTSSEAILRFASDTTPPDTLALPEFEGDVFEIPGRMTVPVPFSSTLLWRLAPGPVLWFGRTGEYRLFGLRWNGDTTLIVERDYDPPPVTDEERERAVRQLSWFTRQGGQVVPGRIPRYHRAFTDLTIDDAGYLWVSPSRQPPSGSTFDVLDTAGRYLGAVSSSLELGTPRLILGSTMYAVASDSLDVPYVLRLEIVGR